MQLSSVLKVQSTFQLSSSHYRPNPLTMKPPAHPCQRSGGGSKNYYSQEPNIQTTRYNSAGKLLLWSQELEMYSSKWSKVCKQQVTPAHNCPPAVSTSFLSPNKKEEQNTIWRCFEIVIVNLFTNLYLRLPAGLGPGWSPRLNLYWWPSTHPLARALTLHYPEFLGIR